MVDVVIDTDVASFLQKDRAPEWVHEAIRGARIWLTFVTVGELSKWAVVRRWGDTRRDRLDLWVASRPVIPYARETRTHSDAQPAQPRPSKNSDS